VFKEINVWMMTFFRSLIASYSSGEYLMVAIESVNAQARANLEIILVDGISTINKKGYTKIREKLTAWNLFFEMFRKTE
jgi:glycosyltransferase involved in cell wall biosynthesis